MTIDEDKPLIVFAFYFYTFEHSSLELSFWTHINNAQSFH